MANDSKTNRTFQQLRILEIFPGRPEEITPSTRFDALIPPEDRRHYVAWSEDGKQILAAARTEEELYREIDRKGLRRSSCWHPWRFWRIFSTGLLFFHCQCSACSPARSLGL